MNEVTSLMMCLVVLLISLVFWMYYEIRSFKWKRFTFSIIAGLLAILSTSQLVRLIYLERERENARTVNLILATILELSNQHKDVSVHIENYLERYPSDFRDLGLMQSALAEEKE